MSMHSSDRAAAEARATARQLARDVLRPGSGEVDATGAFPAAQLAVLAQAGLFGISIPSSFGGLDLSYLAQAQIFSALAEGCLTTTFVLSQHHACVSLAVATPNETLRRRWLPRLATGASQGANGFNFLNLPPERAPMRATAATGGFHLKGSLPWVSAAREADFLAAGAVLPDGEQILVAVALREAMANGLPIHIDPPMDLVALAGADTAAIHCDELFVAEEDLLLGPGQNLLKSAQRGSTVYVPTAMTLGHARASLAAIADIAERRGSPADEMADWLRGALDAFEADLTGALQAGDFERAPELRGRGNALAVRAAHLALIAGGGTGFRLGQMPQRLYREAGFFSVWSASGAIIPQTLAHLLASDH
jgi:alkylation response protein AidB-like acyl-CoA dehydrogenase